jgi:hypothetical protein
MKEGPSIPYLQGLLKNRKERLERLRKMGAPKVIIENEKSSVERAQKQLDEALRCN